MDLTVAICTHNGADRLPDVLECLRGQILTESFVWEVLVVDNNSTDETSRIIRQFQENWSVDVPLIGSFEAQQGLAYARRKAIAQARGKLIAFLDDDNLPTETWIAAVERFGRCHPRVGAYGSCIQGQYELEPPPNFKRIASFLAIVDRGKTAFCYNRRKDWVFPAGAGLVVRKQVWLDAVPTTPVLAGVKGKSLRGKGEDIETLTYIRKAGWEIWHNPEMQIYHKIPARRLERQYLIRLFKGVGLGRYPFRALRFATWQRIPIIPLYFLKDLYELLLHLFQNGHLLRKDIVFNCEVTLLWWSLISPAYHWRLWLPDVVFKRYPKVEKTTDSLI
ncbi:MAG: hormogonium polysaccharide biosynthesis glycosyltransferase HpsE [Cyanobacteriota bacterium]|nr:hormogonium polysaccharide biosynthesis glycosyltransferase HpsE [Cyanobacteriota bacterium]